MNDEQFEATMECLRDELADNLRARDTAQREAIKRLEASLAHACVLLGEADYQARLWEDYQTENEMEVEDHWVTSQVRDRVCKFLDDFKVAELVRSTHSYPRLVSWSEQMSTCTLVFKEREYYFDLNDDCKDDDAQAEHQEAQGAQAGDERAAFENWASDGGLYPQAVERRGDQYKLAQTHSHWQAWQARASLATQPAAEVKS